VSNLSSDGHQVLTNFPANLKRIRERRGMSQVTLAQEMTALGWPWHQPTVYQFESGKRRDVGFGEAADVAKILAVTLDQLTWAPAEAEAEALIQAAAVTLDQQHTETALAIARLHAARAAAQTEAESGRDSEWPRVREAADRLSAQLGIDTVDRAVADGLAEFTAEAGDEN
jgi:transcriptional regulator with XRE-family HTH domain